MFINADAIVPMLKILAILITTGVFLAFAHGIWIARLARASDLPTHSMAGRIALVCLAALTPMVSYYVVGAARRIASARRDGLPSLIPVVPLVLFVVLSIAVATSAALSNGTPKTDCDLCRVILSRLIWTGLWGLVIYMIVRVFSNASLPRSIAVTLAVMALTAGIMAQPFQ